VVRDDFAAARQARWLKQIIRSAPADLETEEAFEWYAEQSETAAQGFLNALDAIVLRITQNPRQFPAYLLGTRKAVVGDFPYSLIFNEVQDSIVIVAVAHAKRRPGYWRRRLT
jgi:plasmid stabilization system protein ParE